MKMMCLLIYGIDVISFIHIPPEGCKYLKMNYLKLF